MPAPPTTAPDAEVPDVGRALPGPLFQDGAPDRWLAFGVAREVFVAHRLDAVVPTLAAVGRRVEATGAWAAGFVAYEAAPAFDRALRTRPPAPAGPPLVFFTLHDPPQRRLGPPPPSGAAYRVGDLRPSMDDADHRRAVAGIRRRIARGDTYQVNLTYRLRASFEGSPRSFFHDLAAAQLGGLGGYLEAGPFAVCSASPELFFELADGTVTARPMKGTAPRGRWPEEDRARAAALAASEKERAENLMIVDMMRNDLGRLAVPGSVEVPSLFAVERYPTVWQMTSTVTARLAPADDGGAGPVPRVLAALFPCASITGAPKAATSAVIAELETTPRGVYTGALGWIAPGGRARFSVAIRTAVVDRRRGEVEYGVGGGIVWDSRPGPEAAESRLKARVLPRGAGGSSAALGGDGGFELLETLLWTGEVGIRLLEEHLDRLVASAEYFGWFDPPAGGVGGVGRGGPDGSGGHPDPRRPAPDLAAGLRRRARTALVAAVAGRNQGAAGPVPLPPTPDDPAPPVPQGIGSVPEPGSPGPPDPPRSAPPEVDAGGRPAALRLRLLVAPGGEVRVEASPLAAADLGAPDRRGAEALPAVPVVVAARPVDPEDVFLFHKTTRRGVYESALSEARGRTPDGSEPPGDVLLWNPRGELTEATTANLVVALDGRLVTPPLDCGLLAGTLRRRLLEDGEVEEGVVRLGDLERRGGLWLVNSVRGWRRARLPGRGSG